MALHNAGATSAQLYYWRHDNERFRLAERAVAQMRTALARTDAIALAEGEAAFLMDKAIELAYDARLDRDKYHFISMVLRAAGVLAEERSATLVQVNVGASTRAYDASQER